MTDHKTVRDALEFYADKKKSTKDIYYDGGNIAREALAALDRIEATTAEKNKADLDYKTVRSLMAGNGMIACEATVKACQALTAYQSYKEKME